MWDSRSSLPRDWTRAPCIGKWVLNHCTPGMPFLPSHTPIGLWATLCWFWPDSLDGGPVICALPSNVLSAQLVFDPDSWQAPGGPLTYHPTTYPELIPSSD